MVQPGAKLSLQNYHYRAERWMVVSGRAEVVVEDGAFLLTENESTDIPLRAKDRTINRRKVPALVVKFSPVCTLARTLSFAAKTTSIKRRMARTSDLSNNRHLRISQVTQ